METGTLGKFYHNGEAIIRQGEPGDCMFVVQKGQVEVNQRTGEKVIRLAVLGEGDFFGEMALFERQVRSATVCALGDACVLTLDKKTFLRRVHEDPSLALNIVEKLCRRTRQLNTALSQSLGRRKAPRTEQDRTVKVAS